MLMDEVMCGDAVVLGVDRFELDELLRGEAGLVPFLAQPQETFLHFLDLV